jgi:hypothetical protein
LGEEGAGGGGGRGRRWKAFAARWRGKGLGDGDGDGDGGESGGGLGGRSVRKRTAYEGGEGGFELGEEIADSGVVVFGPGFHGWAGVVGGAQASLPRISSAVAPSWRQNSAAFTCLAGPTMNLQQSLPMA